MAKTLFFGQGDDEDDDDDDDDDKKNFKIAFSLQDYFEFEMKIFPAIFFSFVS